MMKVFLVAAGLFLATATATAADRVLLVVSSAGTPEDPESGYEFDELTQAYWTFVDNGYEVEIASPVGGEPQSEGKNPMWAFNARFLDDHAAMAAVKSTTPLAEVSAADFDAAFVIGGSGAAVDLPDDKALQAILAAIHQQGGVIGAVCHGPAALVNVEIDGRHLLAGRRLTAFTNDEQALFGEKADGGWSLEDRIVSQGASFHGAPIMHLNVVEDDRLVTGQNPFSTALAAEATIRAMGREPKAREPYRSERTMQLAQLALERGLDPAAEQLAAAPEAHEPMFLALLGYYQLQAAEDDAEVRDALTLMRLSQPHFQNDKVELAMATAHERLGEIDQARQVLSDVLERDPQSQVARERLAALAD